MIAHILFGLLLMSSGHHIPAATIKEVVTSFILLMLLIAVTLFAKNRIKLKRESKF
jgi:hypothetical protein